jgi:Winged helix DNA-binding domain
MLTDQLSAAVAGLEEACPLRLLGGFDTLLLGYADRSTLLDPEHSGRVNAGGGLIKATVLADGQVVGTWTYRPSRRPDELMVETFRPVGRGEVEAIESEALDVGRFLGTGPVATALSVASSRG